MSLLRRTTQRPLQHLLPFDLVVDVARQNRQIARELARSLPSGSRLSFARRFTAVAVSTYWNALQTDYSTVLPLPDPPDEQPGVALDDSARSVAADFGEVVSSLDPIEAGFQLGSLYTSMLPPEFRSRQGVYYTPPALTKRLIAMATSAGVDWKSCRVLDPACGGGAFLTPVALRMVEELSGCEPALILQNLVGRLKGFEIDPFGAWMSQVLLEAAVIGLCHSAGRRLPQVAIVCDSLQQRPTGSGFDLVIGNPPYGRVRLSTELRNRYRRSLHGHANLYGVFTDLAIRWVRNGGVIAYVTPTSFLGGEYFKALRGLIALEAPPVAIDLVMDRKDVFEDVLQETLLATYRRDGLRKVASVHVIVSGDEAELEIQPAGHFTLPEDTRKPWILPRSPDQAPLIARMAAMPHRLRDYGYKVSTGPLVWNRHKPQLSNRATGNSLPVIWAESVTPEGSFVYRCEKKNHASRFQVHSGDDWLITRATCVLVQRTTAKEQRRRLIAAELPISFLREHGAVVIENHLNMLRPLFEPPLVSPSVVTAMLNSGVVDEAFRCINGSVAVSASELEALPLPEPRQTGKIERLLQAGASKEEVDQLIRDLYLGRPT